MSEHDSTEHSAFIKTPKQLLIVVALAFIVPVVLIAILASLAARGVAPSAKAVSEEAVAKRLQPVGQVVVAEGSDVPGQRTGKQIAESVCAACHVTGALNAPKMGDAGAWQKLIKEGLAQLTQDAIKGVRQMPPRGGDPSLTDVEVARAVAYMANQSGAKFEEPPIQAAPATQAAAPPQASQVAAAASGAATVASRAAPGGAAQAGGGGKSVFDTSCAACHIAGVAGAPKTGDKTAWAPRMKQGMDALHEAALKGKGAMPAKGGNMSLSEADVRAAVDYMVSQSK